MECLKIKTEYFIFRSLSEDFFYPRQYIFYAEGSGFIIKIIRYHATQKRKEKNRKTSFKGCSAYVFLIFKYFGIYDVQQTELHFKVLFLRCLEHNWIFEYSLSYGRFPKTKVESFHLSLGFSVKRGSLFLKISQTFEY